MIRDAVSCFPSCNLYMPGLVAIQAHDIHARRDDGADGRSVFFWYPGLVPHYPTDKPLPVKTTFRRRCRFEFVKPLRDPKMS
eukprot:1850191-Pyramimonas_sp.AAC.1